MPHAQVLLDGVTYLAGHREPVIRVLPVDAGPPSPETARAALRTTIDGLEGLDARLRAGFTAMGEALKARVERGASAAAPARIGATIVS